MGVQKNHHPTITVRNGFYPFFLKRGRTVSREWEEVMVVKKKEGRRRWVERDRE
jgi:hypothetical protein